MEYCVTCGQKVTGTDPFKVCACEDVTLRCWVQEEDLPQPKREDEVVE
jgi:hypothetical protein